MTTTTTITTEHPHATGLSQTETTINPIAGPDETSGKNRRADSPLENGLPFQQDVALLQAARQRLVLTQAYPVPQPKTDDELVVEIRAIGLNPVDWKSMYAPPFDQPSDMADNESSAITTLPSHSYHTLQVAILLVLLSRHPPLRVAYVLVILSSVPPRIIVISGNRLIKSMRSPHTKT